MAGTRGGGRWRRRRLHLEALEPRLVLDASMLRITELVASNDNGLADFQGERVDWLELYNSGDDLVDLSGMFLTDTAGNLTRWQIPNGVTLEAGGYKVVFASNKNGVYAGGELHTNFALSAGGEFLALVDTNGTTVIDQYNFPAQLEDVSYGVTMQEVGAPTTLLTAGAAAKAIRPTSSALGNAWRNVGYDDSTWPISGPTGLGYENNPGDAINYTSLIATPLPSGTSTAYVRLKFNLASLNEIGRLKLRVKYDDGFAAYINGVLVAQVNAPETLQWDSAAAGTHDDALSIAFQDFDISTAISALRVGENVLAVQALNQPTGSDMLIVPELVAQSMQLVDPESLGFFQTPTPGYGNGPSVLGFAAEPTFTVPHGMNFTSTQTVGIITTTPGAIVVYTTNGSTPQVDVNLNVTNGTLYSGPLSISSTTTLRARAFKLGFEPSFVESSSYIFVNDVINQSTLGQVPAGWAANGVNGQEINYGIDPDIVNLYGATAVKNSLTSLPSISITTDLANLFDPVTGIYVNANNRGNSWERPANVELITPVGSPDLGFEVNVGLRIRGGYSRNDFNPKHAFRFYFRSEYGDSKLNYPLFGDEGAAEFDVLDLRTEQNYSWSGDGNAQNSFLREVFGRDTQGDMGSQYTRSRYYHLYIDGVYWGVYMAQERVEEFYSENYFGGDQDDYDIVKSGLGDVGGTEVSEGNDTAWRRLFDYGQALAANPTANANLYWTMQGRNPDGTRNPNLPVLLDPENLADYMLIIFFTGGFDTGISRWISDNVANNWFGVYNRVTADQGFQFFIHDNEHSLGADFPDHASQNIDRTGPFNNGNQNSYAQFAPPFLHQDLMASPEYKQLFIDRVQKFMFNGGALTTAQNVARLMERKNQVDPAIIAEAARWGDSKVAVPYNKTNWQNEVNWLVNTYFPSRGNTVIAQLRNDGLYSPVGMTPPTFSQHGGTVPNNYPLTIASSTGTVYYTTDGVTDPRAVGGGVNSSAAVKTYTGTVPISGATTVKARLQTSTGQWSGLVEAAFTTVTLAGDYNGSGGVDQNDYSVWKSTFGDTVTSGSGADGSGNGVIDAADYAVWRNNFGASLGLGGGAGAGSAAESVDVAPTESVARLSAVAENSVQSSAAVFIPFGNMLSSTSEVFTCEFGEPTPGKSSGFYELLLAATRPIENRISATLDDVFAELSPGAVKTDSELLGLLAGDALGLPKLPL